MKFLKKLIASLLVLVITVSVSAYILTATLFNARYMQGKLASQRFYSSMAKALPATLVPGNTPDALTAQQGLAQLTTDNYIQAKVDPLMQQLQTYYQSGGPAPRLDLTDLGAEAQRQGAIVPADSPLSKPVTINPPLAIKAVFNWINLIKLAGPVIGLFLLTLLILLHRGWHRFTAVTKVCLAAAGSEGLVFVLFKFSPGLLDTLVKSKADAAPITPLLLNFFKSILVDVGNDFGKAALALIVAAVLTLIVGLIAKAAGFVGRHTGSGKNADRLARPNPDSRPTL